MKKFFNSKFITIICTLIVFFVVFSFIYPFFIKPKSNVAKTDVYMAPPIATPKQESVVKKIVEVPIIAKAVEVFAKPDVVFYGTSNSNFIDPKKFADGPGLYSLIRELGNSSSQSTRNFDVTSFSAHKSGYYVYFAWPTSYENGGVQNCNSISYPYELKVGTIDCFAAGGTPNFIFTLTDSFHRTIPDFVDSTGAVVSYELYRAHNPIDLETTVYFTVF